MQEAALASFNMAIPASNAVEKRDKQQRQKTVDISMENTLKHAAFV